MTIQNQAIEILPKRTMYYGRNVHFLNPNYREIRTMGGRTNRGPSVRDCKKGRNKKCALQMCVYACIVEAHGTDFEY